MKRSVRVTANRKPDEEQMKKIGGFPESLVSSQFLFHQSRYCSLFAPFPSPPMFHHPIMIMKNTYKIFSIC